MQSLDAILFFLALFAALGCALVAGVFFAFSNFVMKALARIHPSSGVAAMQSINVTVLNPGFLGLFLGTAAICLALLVAALLIWPGTGAAILLIGSSVYLVGSFMVTAAFNVPRNKALARVDGSSPESLAHWRAYVSGWTRWNHVRTIAALAAAAALTIALTRLPGSA
jgi:uncharacterized membrane protein